MNRFDYVKPASVADAIAAASQPGAAYLASGTNLLDLMKGNVVRPERLVDISRLPELTRIEQLANGDLRIGAVELDRQAVAEALADLGFDPTALARAAIRAADGDVIRFPGGRNESS